MEKLGAQELQLEITLTLKLKKGGFRLILRFTIMSSDSKITQAQELHALRQKQKLGVTAIARTSMGCRHLPAPLSGLKGLKLLSEKDLHGRFKGN